MTKVIDHFLYLIELHANNSYAVYSPALSSQIPKSYAANAFFVFQRSMYQLEIVRLCALWDRAELEKENITTVIELIDNETIIRILAANAALPWTIGYPGHIAVINPTGDPQRDCFGKDAPSAFFANCHNTVCLSAANPPILQYSRHLPRLVHVDYARADYFARTGSGRCGPPRANLHRNCCNWRFRFSQPSKRRGVYGTSESMASDTKRANECTFWF
jgi:AbiU2